MRFISGSFDLWPDKRTRLQALKRPARSTRHLGTILGAFCPLKRPGRDGLLTAPSRPCSGGRWRLMGLLSGSA